MSVDLRGYFENYDSLTIKDYCIEKLQNSHVDFSAIIALAHRLTLMDAELKSSNYKQRNFMAENMFGNYVGLLYDNYSDLMSIDSQKRPYLKLADNLRVYPKKLNEKYLPSNVKTNHVSKLNAQQLFEDDSHVHVIYAGFIVTDQVWPNDLKGHYMSFVNTYYPGQVEWVLDLTEFSKGKLIELPIHVQQIEERLVTAKRNLSKTGEADS